MGVTNLDSQLDLARKLQIVERDRIELVQQAVDVLRSIQMGNRSALTESLAGVIGLAYLLATRMGIPPHQIDQYIERELATLLESDSERDSEFREVVRYISEEHV